MQRVFTRALSTANRKKDLGARTLEEEHVFKPSSLNLIKVSTWVSCTLLGVYLVGVHDWRENSPRGREKDNVFTSIKPQLRKMVTEIFRERE